MIYSYIVIFNRKKLKDLKADKPREKNREKIKSMMQGLNIMDKNTTGHLVPLKDQLFIGFRCLLLQCIRSFREIRKILSCI